ncbi:glycosyltransferase family 2 protein [Rhodopila globiformis]|uniref:glycosyltransferase family 2 protein n=1 Tax=Rhodopila globiformis TaxID=1071 RepID=UPI001304E5AD|nr:glycosyltransferase family 2 protein [Rhodopila globiformis]
MRKLHILTVKLNVPVAVIVVGYRNEGDIVGCLAALSRAEEEPGFEIFVAENGGRAAAATLVETLRRGVCTCPAGADGVLDSPLIVECNLFYLLRQDGTVRSRVHVAQMAENLGYAGAINAMAQPLLKVAGWDAIWIVNPDTEPSPTALAELRDHSTRRARGMVGSCIISAERPEVVRTRGLAWSNLSARTLAVDFHTPRDVEPNEDDLELRLGAPSGASIYVTRSLLGQIGLPDESYFLFFEDLDWGLRAKRLGALGYAHRSVVLHRGGTTIGTNRYRGGLSPLAVYLEIRNRILFVRAHHPRWLPWTILMQFPHVAAYGTSGGLSLIKPAIQGLIAGVKGESGRPDRMLQAHAAWLGSPPQ